MSEKRRDNKGRLLKTGESQRADGRYLYKYVDAQGQTRYVYSWKLVPTDPVPKGKRNGKSLRELEAEIQRDLQDGIDTTGGKMTLCQTERTEGKREEKHPAGQKDAHADIRERYTGSKEH